MARVLAFIPDLLFGSHVVAGLSAAGHEVQLASSPEHAAQADVLIADLTAETDARIAQIAALGAGRPPTLAFFAHVEPEVRRSAQVAGIDLVVPRSRMNREGPALVEQLLARR